MKKPWYKQITVWTAILGVVGATAAGIAGVVSAPVAVALGIGAGAVKGVAVVLEAARAAEK